MNEGLTKVWSQIKEQFAKMSKRAKIITFSTLGAIVIMSVIVSLILNNQPYEILFTRLNPQETSEIIGKLQEMGANNYKIEDNGTILVPKDQEPRLKALLVSEGHPKNGFSYDIFMENINLMSTDFEKNAIKLFDLQNRIGSTIELFDGVSFATVTISLPEEAKYVLQKDKTEATASVFVTMTNGGSPTADQVKAMITLISTSVAGLKPENIGVTDSTGKDLTDNTSEVLLGATQLKLALEQEIENSVKQKVMNLLSPIYGEDRVSISVMSTVDVDKKIREIINYNTPNNQNRGIISSESRDIEAVQEDGTVGGPVGTETNAEVPVYPNITIDGDEVYFRDKSDINYIVSQVTEQVQSDAGVLTDLYVSVAVGDARPDDLRMEEIKKMVAVAAGITTEAIDEKVALYYTDFITADDSGGATAPGTELPPYLMWIILGASGFVTLLLLTLLFLLLRKRKKTEEIDEELIDEELGEGELEIEAGGILEEEDISDINLKEIKNTREMELKKQIGDFAQENPEISAQLIRTWLQGEEGD